MSAPRKIWAYDDGLNSPDSRTWSATVPVGPAYHHDDVVREMARALREMVYEATHLSPMEPDGSHWCKISEEALTASRAALAKIAQEDADLNAIADDRKDGPFVPVDLRDL